eukprot:m.166089 g.166089  ORF g.166089 m.166089 type:complete len:58 (-) comp14440_c0_seq1:4033-4206(-)
MLWGLWQSSRFSLLLQLVAFFLWLGVAILTCTHDVSAVPFPFSANQKCDLCRNLYNS